MAGISDKGWDLGGYLREQREHARLSVRQLANLAGVSNPYLSQIERGLRRPSAEVLQQIARGLRISAEALYVRAGILDSEGRPDVETAVNADPELNDRQRLALLDIYASFRADNRRAAAPEEPEPTPRRRPTVRMRSSVRRVRSTTRSAAVRASRPARGVAAQADVTAATAIPPEPAVAGRTPRRRAAKRATARLTEAAGKETSVGSEAAAPEPDGAPDTPR